MVLADPASACQQDLRLSVEKEVRKTYGTATMGGTSAIYAQRNVTFAKPSHYNTGKANAHRKSRGRPPRAQ